MQDEMVKKRIRNCHAKGGVYIVVLGTAMFVTVVGMSALLMARINTRITNADRDIVKARYYAQSLIEVGMLKAMTDPNWRTTHTNDIWSTDYTWDETVVTYKFVDENDADLADNPADPVRLYAKATVNDAVRIYSVVLRQVGASSETSEILLSSHDPGGTSSDMIQEWYWHSQYFQPSLPPGTTSWSVTRVRFQAEISGNGSDGITKVQLRTEDGSSLPTSTVLEEKLMNETDLTSSPTWQEFAFSGVSGISPTAGLCLVFEWAGGNQSARVEIDYGSTNGGHQTSGDQGSTWVPSSSESVVHYVYGKYITDPPFTPVAGTWRREMLP